MPDTVRMGVECRERSSPDKFKSGMGRCAPGPQDVVLRIEAFRYMGVRQGSDKRVGARELNPGPHGPETCLQRSRTPGLEGLKRPKEPEVPSGRSWAVAMVPQRHGESRRVHSPNGQDLSAAV